MTIDLRTTYLGLELKNPVIASASPLTGHLETLCQLQEAGAAAVVLPSLFEEQLERDELAVRLFFELGVDHFVKTLNERPELDQYNKGPASYLGDIKRAKETLSIPVIAGLNGAGLGNWARHADSHGGGRGRCCGTQCLLRADRSWRDRGRVEKRYFDLVAAVREAISIPLAVKLAPNFTSLPNFVAAWSK